ncbi:TIGR03915 family putative DNA repair protein [Algibacter sp.]|nr:TIGR03915 family putative DNA repair protein [Algibacter sp.]
MQASNLIYDGTFDGFLTSVFYVYEYKLENVAIQKKTGAQNLLFSEPETVITDTTKADRVWKGLKQKLSKASSFQVYYAFLSEKEHIEVLLLDYIKYAFESIVAIDKDYAHPTVLKIAQIAKMVGREKHRMEAFVRFKLTKDKIYFANIDPDFNVLPLISKHFKSRYADQKWVIYDLKRRYGLFYDLNTVEIINLNFSDEFDPTKTSPDIFSDEEFEFQKLWQDYFKSTNIESRKNMKLHIRHVPKRYWKYLSEKQPN